MKTLIFSLLLLSTSLLARGYNPQEICVNVDKAVKEANFIYKKFDDPTNALVLLNGTDFRSITYRKPDCMTEKQYLSYLEKYAFYSAKSTKNSRNTRTLEEFVKKYPNRPNFLLYLANAYENNYFSQNYYRNKGKMRTQAIDTYKKYIELAKKQKQRVDKHALEFVKSGGLKKAEKTWGKYLNPQNKIPLGSFQAYYIDTREPKKVIYSEGVDTVSINYPYDQFHNINSANFGGYWVGKVKYDKDTKENIVIYQSQATTRIIVDGYIIYDGTNSAEIPYEFKKGVHTIEVEHLNRWHTTNLLVKILPMVKKYSRNELQAVLKPLVEQQTQFWYVGVYESERKGNDITLRIQKSDKPVVLMLQSHRMVTWNIVNDYNVEIKAIVANSTSMVSSISGDVKNSKIFFTDYPVGRGYKSGLEEKRNQKCKCIANGILTCGSSSGFDADTIPKMFGKKIRGFSGKYRTAILAVPQVQMSDKIYREIEVRKEKIDALRAKCTKNKQINTEDLFR
ncbi:tetratricopeptide repeat protein [Sulfurimonas marina]|uniref:PEGA domain-containing protein n=1 Tax=Sulfurimonas marina TaxID=2590551 RepID=A0A7M1ASZ0_9BACT|nr:hypothetical protein [Sulfurimonas marina]QOP40526.1 hypothetical protein FJR03_01720 [Sulfurimonas marina]